MAKRILLVASLLFAVCARGAIGIGDSYEQVLAAKGAPTGRMQAGDVVVLRYPEGTIRLKGGKVVAVTGDAAFGTVTVARRAADDEPRASATNLALVEPGAWTVNYRGALATAKDQDRRVFLFFTGSDWCPWCMRLNREILSTPAFRQYAHDKLVLVEVDFPRERSQSDALKRQNAALLRAFNVGGYPTVVILDANGREVGRLGYEQGGPDPFLRRLKAL